MRKICDLALAALVMVALALSACSLRGGWFGETDVNGERLLTPMEMDRFSEPAFVDFYVARLYYDALDETQQRAYRCIYNAVFSYPERIRIPSLTEAELREVMLALRGDNPILFFLNNTYSYSFGTGRSYVCPDYLSSGETADAELARLMEAARRIAAAAEAETEPFARELKLHDALCAGCEYGTGAYDTGAYGALVNGRAVCEGYSFAAKLLFDLAGLESCVVSGAASANGASESHMWNAVRVSGDWYLLDCTWDDPVRESGGPALRHSYFNLDEETMSRSHTPARIPPLPGCDGTAENYFRKLGLYCTAADWRAVMARALAEADPAEGAEFRFESEALLEEAVQALFADGAIWELIPAGGRCVYSQEPNTNTLYLRTE